MATLKVNLPNGDYPLDYDYLPTLGELLVWEGVTKTSNTTSTVVYTLSNGLVLKLSGSGFAFDSGGFPTGGTITSLRLYLEDGTSVLHTLTGLSRSLETFFDTAEAYPDDPWQIQQWLMTGNDTLYGLSNGWDDLYGGNGNDTFHAGKIGSYMHGGNGVDTYNGNIGWDTITFDSTYYDENVIQGVTANLATGKATDPWGNAETFTSIEELRGTQFADTFIGSDADFEDFAGLGGSDKIDGAGGYDTVRYDRDVSERGGGRGVTVDLAAGTATDGFGRKDTLKNIEGVRGTNLVDKVDKLYGSDVYNDLRGFAGDDWLDGRGDGDSMAGGRGNDTYVIDSVNDFVEENRDNGDGIDTVRSTITVNLADTNHFRGDVENVTLLGTDGLTVDGNGLKNTIIGNSGANTLRGGDADDTISGGDGVDKISGGRGNDKLAGNAGADSYYFGNALSATTNVDTISGFSTIDSIYLSKAIFTQAGPVGTLAASAFAAIPSNTSGNTGDASDRIIYQSDTGRILYDPDGSGAAASTVFAVVATGLALTNADFVIY